MGKRLEPSGGNGATRADAAHVAGLNAEHCWQAVLNRDIAPQRRFFYGVRTTGIYCRPGCISRLPNRRNVRFFETAGAAEAAGFRPCKRCRPAETSMAARHLAAVENACRIIRTAERAPSLSELAGAVGVSRFHFHRLFKQITGTTPRDYAGTHRLNRFAQALEAGRPVADAAYESGYGSVSRAYEAAPAALGMTPGARRRGGERQTIRFITAESPIGWVLVAATGRGVCAIALGDDSESLVRRLRARMPAATLIDGDSSLRGWMEKLVNFIASPAAHAPELPLDLRSTAFQASVWRALKKIPPGKTASYAEIAAAIGRPTAVRAVARACASNNVALLIPCHRAVRRDGTVGGYRWGAERKRALLERERASSAASRPGPRKPSRLQ